MKLIHCADIHLGSAMSSRLPREKAQLRKSELRSAFSAMVAYARKEEIGVILLAGDVFDSDRPAKKDKEFFYSVVRNNPDIDFVYLRGNHDQRSAYQEQDIPNLKTFSDTWSCYRYDGATVWGLELTGENHTTAYDAFKADRADTNIVMLHGQVADSPGEGRLCLARLREKEIDYLALGHIHGHSQGVLDSRGIWCYSGCLEGRGYDEIGEKGFVVLDTQDLAHPRFVAQSRRIIRKIEVDVTGCEEEYQAIDRCRGLLPREPENLLRLELVGQLPFDSGDLARELETQLEGSFFHLSVKNRTQRRFDIQAYIQEVSLAGEYIRQVQALSLSPEESQQLIDLGLRALSGQEVSV